MGDFFQNKIRMPRIFAPYRDRRMATLLALGFASGLPAPLIFTNLSIWLRDAGVSRTDIGLFALVATPYAVNFLWAPLVDRLPLPWFTRRFGQRRGWALACQVLLMAAILVMAATDPAVALLPVALAALCVSFLSATQDIVIDAYRIEVLEPEQFAAGSAVAIWGWHLGGTLVGGAGGLYLAQMFGWHLAWLFLGLALAVGMLAVLLAPEPVRRPLPATLSLEREKEEAIRAGLGGWRGRAAAWLYGAAMAPFAEFMRRRGWLLVLLFIFVFKLGDALLGRMSGVFYRELGFSLIEIADVAKVYGLGANVLGVLAGGVLCHRLGIFRGLLVAGLFAAVTNLTYSWLALSGMDRTVFILAVVSDNFTAGLVTVAFVAYLSSLCNVAYTATQYAMLASLGNLARIWLSAASGWMVDSLGGDWALFFAITALIALAGLPLLLVIMYRFPGTAPRTGDG